MGKHFSSRVLLIPIVFLIVIIFGLVYAYDDVQERKYNFAKKEAEVLNSFAMSHRNYYQSFFVNKTIKLSAETLPALPAFSSSLISNNFSRNNSLNITVKAVSDKARNYKNMADKDELKAIEFFKTNRDKSEYFSDENSKFYQYAYALRIEKKCLACHGAKENAPKLIQERYENAYDYKLGEIRGIQSIKIPSKNLDRYFLMNFFHSVIYDTLLFIALFLTIFYLIKKSKSINDFLGTEVERKTKEVKNLLVFDTLTKMPNRLKLIEDIKQSHNLKPKHLALINIDSFRDINDFYGYKIGDDIIKEIALTLQHICKCSDTNLYKLPSDEYAIFSTKDISKKAFFNLVKNLIQTVQKNEFQIDNYSIFITLSCGTASNEKLLLTKADIALLNSKNNKKHIVQYDDSFDTTAQLSKNIQGVALLKNAIEQDNIVPFFQPIYSVHADKIEKYECLARIIAQEGRIVSPFEFLDIAIKSKLYPNITQTIISKSFEFFKDKEYEFSINLSINDITNKKTVHFIEEALKDFNNPQKVVFEILESDKIGNYQELKEFIHNIKQFGCKFAIDDFGSGYSNFAHVLELNVDYLKIDASLVKYITTDENSRVITKTIINFASNLGLKTIAEFVEDRDALEILEKMGVDFIQGYYIGKPDSGLNKDFS